MVQALSEAFSVTPKIRAMQIIADLEGTTRGPYGGCVRLFQLQRQSASESPHPNPLPIGWGEGESIRTALLKDGKACVQASGGWVNDSEPEAEFQETVNKSKAMLKAVALAETFAKTP
jgi:anthranilate synthase component I